MRYVDRFGDEVFLAEETEGAVGIVYVTDIKAESAVFWISRAIFEKDYAKVTVR